MWNEGFRFKGEDFEGDGLRQRVSKRWVRRAAVALLVVFAAAAQAHGQVLISEIQARNGATIEDEDGQSSDWFELVNYGDEAVELAGYGVSDDLNGVQWRLPEMVVEPQEHVVIWASGKARNIPSVDLVVSGQVPVDPTLVSMEAEWAYLVGDELAADPSFPSGWETSTFDDSNWNVGQAVFGYGEENLGTEVPAGGTLLLRHRFFIDDLTSLRTPILRLDVDDACVGYINGKEFFRINIDESVPLNFASFATHSDELGENVQIIDLESQRSLFETGENVIAFAVFDRNARARDLGFIVELGEPPSIPHTNFQLASEGEQLSLWDSGDVLLDSVRFPRQTRDRAYGRIAPAGAFFYLLTPTPGAPNDTLTADEEIAIRPVLDPPPGEYRFPIQFVVRPDGFPLENVEFRYTTDGSDPTIDSMLYEQGFVVSFNQVLRAAAFVNGECISQIATHSYFFQSDNYELPILSVSMNPEDFSDVHLQQARERDGHVEFFDAGGSVVASTGAGLRLHGGGGRSGGINTKKAYRLYFRSVYGDTRLREPIFPDSPVANFDKLVLRANYNDSVRSSPIAAYIRDEVIRQVHADMGALSTHGTWYNLFVNMEYRGVYNIVERMDKEFFAEYFPDEGDDWYVVKAIDEVLDGGEAARAAWNELNEWFSTADLSDPTGYAEARGRIDLNSYTSYMIVNTWTQNHDWPQRNWYAGRPARPGGKWLFLCWDAEWGLGRNPQGFLDNSFARVIERPFDKVVLPFIKLLENVEYQKFFLTEVDRYLLGALSPENVIDEIRRQAATIRPDIPEESQLPPPGNFEVSMWEENVLNVEDFVIGRAGFARSMYLQTDTFDFPRVTAVLPDSVMPEGEIDVVVRGRGFIAQTSITFNDVVSPSVRFDSPDQVTATLPYDIRVDGQPVVHAANPVSGGFSSPGVLTVRFPRPEPTSIVPTSGGENGGELIMIRGSGFGDDVRVEFDGIPAAGVEWIDSETLNVVTPPGSGEVGVRVINTQPGDLPSESSLTFTYSNVLGGFRRGDSDGDGGLDVSDPIVTLRMLFAGATDVPCDDALDTDDSGLISLGDALLLLNYLFEQSTPSPAPPFSSCGTDPTTDTLSCDSGTGC